MNAISNGIIKVASQAFKDRKFDNSKEAEQALLDAYSPSLANNSKDVWMRLNNLFNVYLKTSSIETCRLALINIFPDLENAFIAYEDASKVLLEEEFYEFNEEDKSLSSLIRYLGIKTYEKRKQDYDEAIEEQKRLEKELELLKEKIISRQKYEQAIVYLKDYKIFIQSKAALSDLERSTLLQIQKRDIKRKNINYQISELEAKKSKKESKKNKISQIFSKNKIKELEIKIVSLKEQLESYAKQDKRDEEYHKNAVNGIKTLEKDFLLAVGLDYTLMEYEKIINCNCEEKSLNKLEKMYNELIEKIHYLNLDEKTKTFNRVKLLYGKFINSEKKAKAH